MYKKDNEVINNKQGKSLFFCFEYFIRIAEKYLYHLHINVYVDSSSAKKILCKNILHVKICTSNDIIFYMEVAKRERFSDEEDW